MGTTRGYICEKCGYEFTSSYGVGFMYPAFYRKTIDEMKAGKYGELGKLFFEMYPDGAVDISEATFKCRQCEKYMSGPRLAMFTPKIGYNHSIPTGTWSVVMPWKGQDYVSPFELEENYDLVGEYDHKCSCGGEVQFFSEKKFLETKVICPKCRAEMECNVMECWD